MDECAEEDLIWEDKPDVLSVTHTKALLDWKKAYKGIKAIAIKKGNKIQATCIYSLSDYDGSRIVKLEKCCVSRDSSITLKVATALSCRYLLKHHPDAAFVRVWAMPNSEWAKALKGLFFVKSSHPNPFIIKQDGNSFSKMKWDLSFFDLD